MPATPLLVSTMMPRPPSPPAAFPPPYPIHNPSISTQFDRKQKQRAMMGITAGAEDVKYQAKYRELKKKVKEIELVRPTRSRAPTSDSWVSDVVNDAAAGQ